MKLITRYILREYLTPLCYCLLGFVSIYVLFESFGSFGRLLEAKPPVGVTIHYFAAYISPFFEYLAPAALMLAAIYTMWNFCRHSELVAMRANGISFGAIARPILIVAVLMTAFVYWVNNVYVPENAPWAAAMKAERFRMDRVDNALKIVYPNVRSHRTWTIGGMSADAKHLESVRVVVDDSSGSRLMNIASDRVEYLDGEWWFHDPKVQHFDSLGNEIATPTPELDALPLRCFGVFNEKPRDFVLINRKWEYKSLRERVRYLKIAPDLSEKDRRQYVYDIWAKALSPLACLVIVIFAIPAGIASGRQSVFRGILGALGMFFGFYALVIFGMIAAGWSFMPPFVPAVLPYVVFLLLGIRTFRRLM